jgi:hypothetical protein
MSITSPLTALHPPVIGDAGAAAAVEGSPAMLAIPQPDIAIDAGLYGPLVVRAASVRGAGHRYDGTPRQDDFCLAAGGRDNEWFVIAVGDGVSAGPSSHVASRAAVRFGSKLVADRLDQAGPEQIDWDDVIGSTAGFVLAQARNETGNRRLEARDAARVMATTIVFAIVPVYPDRTGVRRCTVVPIGDTSGWILRKGGQWEPVTEVKNQGNAVAVSATAALPLLPSGPVVPLAADLQAGDALFVLTDGVGDPLGAGTGEVGKVLAAAWSRPPDRYQFAAQVDFRRRSHTDDRTVVAVWPDQQPDDGSAPSPAPAAATALTTAPVVADILSSPVTEFQTPAMTTPSLEAPVVSEPPTSEPPTSEPPSTEEPWQPTPWQPTPWEPT